MKPTDEHLEALKELINIGVGKGAEVLNSMLSSHISLSVPFVRIVSSTEFLDEVQGLSDGALASVDLGFKGEFNGTTQLVFSAEAASKLVTALTGDADFTEDLDTIRSGTLCEVGNVVLNGVMGSLGNILGTHLVYTVPNFREGSVEKIVNPLYEENDTMLLLAKTNFTVKELEIDGDLVLYFEFGALETILSALDKMLVDY